MNYGKGEHLASGSIADLDQLEQDLIVVTNAGLLTDSQLSVFINLSNIGTHTDVNFRYYARHVVGGDWYELPYRNEGTGVITSVPTQMADAGRLVDSLPLPACMAFKMTATGVGGANAVVEATIMSRDN